MAPFLRIFFASLLGTLAAITVLLFFLFSILISGSRQPEPRVPANSVITIDLRGDIPARIPQDPLQELFSAQIAAPVSVEGLKRNLEKAAVDDRVSGIWLRLYPVSASWADLRAAREALVTFKESGKWIYASTGDQGLNEKSYYLASTADSLFTPESTWFEFNGFSMHVAFYSDFLEKLGVEPEIFRVGEYKSAVEPFIRMDSSPENSEQFESILDEAADTFASAVEEKTGLNRNTIDHLLETIPEDPVRFALEHRLIDKIATPDEVRTLVGERLGLMEDEEPSIMEFRRYDLISDQSAGVQSDDTEDAIALVYATGPILPEAPDMLFGGTDVITANTLGRTFRSIMEEGQIDGIVLYIDSPGGAATTSDLIWHQIQDIKKEIPVVAYLGNVAASGGYYMASAADSIVSSPSSITGSIGIYSILLNAHELFSDRLGIGVETFKSHEHADLYSISRQLTPSEQSALQHSVEAGYDLFLQRVADGRNMEKEEVNRLGRGRVWTGREAKEHRLVDRLGTLEDALSMTADMAELDSYRVITYPDRKPLLELLFGSAQARFTGSLRSLFMIPEPLNDLEKMLRSPSGIHWALLPVQIDTD